MQRVILVYANCRDRAANGDYTLAGNIARDLCMALAERNKIAGNADKIDVVLTSTADGMPAFMRIYGTPVNGRVDIEGQSIGLCSLELFNPANHDVVAYVEATRCKHPPAEILKRVLSADSKFLFIENVNQLAVSDADEAAFLLREFNKEQPGIYDLYDSNDILMGACGMESDRLGLTTIKKAEDLPPLSSEQTKMLPSDNYGFGYLAHIPDEFDNEKMTFVQYMMLTNYNHYVLVGNFIGTEDTFKTAYASAQITIHVSLDYPVMRRMSKHATGNLVVSTGVNSTIEALQDGKLTYYQVLPINEPFVTSYLKSVESICSSDLSATTSSETLSMTVRLSKLLFANKPLSQPDFESTQKLLADNTVTSTLITANQLTIKKANGTLAPRLLTFIGQANHTNAQQQLQKICLSLRKSEELLAPDRSKALRRAAAWGRVFELKALANVMQPAEINDSDTIGHGRTALHWAVIKGSVDCVNILIKRGADVSKQDASGKTPLYYAAQSGNQELIKLLEARNATDVKLLVLKSP